MENSFKFLEKNGIMWIDDYRSSNIVIKTIHNMLHQITGQYELIHKSYQLAIRKL